MNNLRLLAGLLCAVLAGVGEGAWGQRAISLDEIFRVAEANSARLRTSLASEREADMAVDEARMARLPDIDASLSVSFLGDGFTTSRDLTDLHRAPIPHFGQGLGVKVTQLLYTGGAITNSIRLAELKSSAARLATDLQRDNLRMRLTGLYLDIYKCANLRAVVDSNRQAALRVLAEMQARYEQGTALHNDITRYELLVSDLDLELTRIGNTISILNTDLVTLSGLPARTVVIPDSSLFRQAMPSSGANRWQQEAASESPRLKLASSGVEISRRAEDLVRAGRLPKVGLQAGWTMDGPILTEVPPINRNLSYWYVGVGVSYNVSSLFKSDKSLARSRAATALAQTELEDARQEVAMAVNDAYVRWQETHIELATRQKGVELARSNYDIVSTRYAAGMALITDLLDAANSRLDAEQQLVNARINIIYNYYRLLFTVGKI